MAKELIGGVGPVGGPGSDRPNAPRAAVDLADIQVPDGRLVILTDIDGTLLRSDGTASARTVRVLSALAGLGHDVVFATGRALRDLDQVGALTGHRGRTVCANGAAVYDHGTRKVCRTRPFANELLPAVLTLLARAVPEVILAVEDLRGLRFVEGFPFTSSVEEGIPVGGLRESEVLQILAWHPRLPSEEIAGALDVALAGKAEISWGNSLGVVEVNAAGVNKGTTVAQLVAAMGRTADSVVAFGDMPNDLPVLNWAGISFAMQNAHPRVLAAVGRQAPGNDDDGVARVLEGLLGIRPAC
ncbi:HAD hydrolase family protein [Amycolatopsis sp. NPDC059021]|uniref:HAD hydrolase family protein n=1 Tax=Amycolatopsis sp. NPDC059021 TaxID=3346704 RepID=UPI00366E4892